ncbi:MAG: DICT sensory domain-containing protein, partial [Nocardioides sp.]
MSPRTAETQAPDVETSPAVPGLTIGDLAERTGVAPATLRMWERRHGFPVAQRRHSGHRRYDERVVDQVRQVLRRRDAGSRLEVAIAGVVLSEASAASAPGAPSVFAAMRKQHPTLQPQRLRKSSLLALSWAIEDECCALAETPMIFGAFQKERYYRAAEERWTELARVARSTMVFAHFDPETPPVAGRTSFIDLPEDAPMRREWAVVCDAPDHAAFLTAWELPGQSTVRDKDRLFEAIWSVEPLAVRSAARACAQVAVQLGHAEAGP